MNTASGEIGKLFWGNGISPRFWTFHCTLFDVQKIYHATLGYDAVIQKVASVGGERETLTCLAHYWDITDVLSRLLPAGKVHAPLITNSADFAEPECKPEYKEVGKNEQNADGNDDDRDEGDNSEKKNKRKRNKNKNKNKKKNGDNVMPTTRVPPTTGCQLKVCKAAAQAASIATNNRFACLQNP